MCPKVEIVYDTDLGNIKLPSKLKDLLTDYCQQNHQRKSVVVRSALVHWLKADLSTCMDHMLLSKQEENNGDMEAIEKAEKLKQIIMEP